MVRATIKPQSVAEAKALVRAKAEQNDYLEPLRHHPLPVVALGLVGGWFAFRALKKGKIDTATGFFELGVAVARKLL